MTFHILTIFPEMFPCYFESSMLKRAQENKKITINVVNLRDFATDKHRVTDDAAYGGISGMVMKVEPIYRAVAALKFQISNFKFQNKSKIQISKHKKLKTRTILLSAKGKVLTQEKVRKLAKYEHLILIAGHYKGVDERVAKYIADEELSIGEYVLTGGELGAMVVVDAVSRMIPGVIGDEASKEGESFSPGVRYEHPVYTRPEVFDPSKILRGKTFKVLGRKGKGRKDFYPAFRGPKVWRVPKVLLSGDHKRIEEWREKHRKKKIYN